MDLTLLKIGNVITPLNLLKKLKDMKIVTAVTLLLKIGNVIILLKIHLKLKDMKIVIPLKIPNSLRIVLLKLFILMFLLPIMTLKKLELVYVMINMAICLQIYPRTDKLEINVKTFVKPLITALVSVFMMTLDVVLHGWTKLKDHLMLVGQDIILIHLLMFWVNELKLLVVILVGNV